MSTYSKYKAKARDSFKTKLTLYLFDKVITGQLNKAFDLSDLPAYRISQETVELYTTVYWQQKTVKDIDVTEVYRKLKDWQDDNKSAIEAARSHYVNEIFSELFPKVEFDELLQNDSCAYCGITVKEVEQLAEKRQIKKKTERGWTLEIDKLDSNFEYTKDNCVMACYWCNNAKTDEFTEEEFKVIGKAIAEIWKRRLAK